MELTIVSAKFLIDLEFFGHQDPYIEFKYGGEEFTTTVKEEAGKYAEFNEDFRLHKVKEFVWDKLTFMAKDADVKGFKLIGTSEPLHMYDVLCKLKEGTTYRNHVDFFLKGKKSGMVNLEFYAHTLNSDV